MTPPPHVGDMKTIHDLADILTSITSDVRKDNPIAINVRKYTTISKELEKSNFANLEEGAN